MKEFYMTLVKLSEFQRMWAENYIPEDITNMLARDYLSLDDNNNQQSYLTFYDVEQAMNYLDTKMKESFLAVFNL